MGDIYTNPPQSRNEAILRATIDGTEYTDPPQSRIEDLLLELKEAIEEGGGTGEGDMKKSVYDADRAVQNAGGIAAYVGDEITDLELGSASKKNSIAVVTSSTDLVESKAVFDTFQNEKGYLKGKNLARFEQGTLVLSTGLEEASATRVRTQFIPIKQGVTYIASSYNELWRIRSGLGYTENFELISGSYFFPSVSTHKLVVNDSRVKYVRFIYSHIDGEENCSPSDYWYQFEEGDTATAYEPYVMSNIELDEQKADNSVIGTVEDGANPTKSYAVGEHMIRGGKFCTVTVPVTTSSTWTLGGNYVEGDVASELEKTFSKIKNLATTDDLDNIKKVGIYCIGSEALNMPTGGAYSILEVLPIADMGTSSVIQRITKQGTMFTRAYKTYSSPAGWSGWFKYEGTAVS